MKYFQKNPCPVCGDNDSKILYEIKYNFTGVLDLLEITETEKIYLKQCTNCNHYFADPVVKGDMIDKYYSLLNSEYYKTDIENEPNDLRAKEHYSIIKEAEKHISHGKILEVGCGYGHLLEKFDDMRWKKYGIEPSPHAYSFLSKKHSIICHNGYFSKDVFPNEKFDLIIMMDVIEHLYHPNELIMLMKDRLTPRGIIMIGTGNIRSLNAVLSGSHWCYFGSYEHISFFHPDSIAYLLNANALSIKKTISIPQIGNSLQNIWWFIKNLLKLIIHGGLKQKTNFKTRLSFDHMLVIAKHTTPKII